MTGRHADVVRASIAAHDPQAMRTINEAERDLVTAQNNQSGGGAA